jgi:hypothetical protein
MEKKLWTYVSLLSTAFDKTFFVLISIWKVNTLKICKKFTWASTQNGSCFCPTLTKAGMCEQIAVKLSNVKFHGNPFCGSQAVSCACLDKETLIGVQQGCK